MLEMLYPSAYLSDVFSIDYPKLQALGYQGVLFDIDNTLVHHGDDATPEIEHLFAYLNSLGLKILLFSDNSRQRVERFNRNIGVPFLAEAGKPDPDRLLLHAGSDGIAGHLRGGSDFQGYSRC